MTLETIKKAAEITGVSISAIRQAARGGRLTAERRDGHLFVDPAAVAAVCTGTRRGKSGIPGVTWNERRRRWRAIYKQHCVYECKDVSECAAALDAYKNGQLQKKQRDLPVNVYKDGNRYKVQMKREGCIVFVKAASTVEDAIAIRDAWKRERGEL